MGGYYKREKIYETFLPIDGTDRSLIPAICRASKKEKQKGITAIRSLLTYMTTESKMQTPIKSLERTAPHGR